MNCDVSRMLKRLAVFVLMVIFTAPAVAQGPVKTKSSEVDALRKLAAMFAPVDNYQTYGTTPVTLSGRVLTFDDRPIRGALILLIDMEGPTRFTKSSTFGYYSFSDITPGRTYIVGVFHGRYIFASPTQTIDITTNRTDFNLIGEENW